MFSFQRFWLILRVLSTHVLQQHGGTLQKWGDDAGSALPPVRSCLLLREWTGRDRDGAVSWCKSTVIPWIMIALFSTVSTIFYQLKLAFQNWYLLGKVFFLGGGVISHQCQLSWGLKTTTSMTLLRKCMPSASCSSCAHSWPLIPRMRKPIPDKPWGELCATI